MDAVIASIKALVLRYYPEIVDGGLITEDQLDLAVEEVVDRGLAAMNREQLVEQYEEDLVTYPLGTEDFWKGYAYPVPEATYRVLAKSVVSMARSFKDTSTASVGAIKSVSDNGQSVTYADTFQNYFGSSNDSDMFGSATAVLKRYLIGNVYAPSC